MKHSTEEYLRAILKNPLEDGWDDNGEPPLCLIYQKVLEVINPYKSMLEIGPGIGEFSLYLLSQNKSVEMLGIEEPQFMKKICEEKGYNYVFYTQDIVNTTLTKTFDIVVAIEVIEHIKDYQKAVQNMLKLAKHKVVLTTPVADCFYSPDHKHSFSEKSFEFIDKPYKIEQIITKKIDIPTNKRVFLIEINV